MTDAATAPASLGAVQAEDAAAPARTDAAAPPASPDAADVAAALRVRGGLPGLRARAARAARGAALGARVVYVGGSVTAQRDGWRPAFHTWLDTALPAPLGHHAVVAALGNCGAKVLAFLLQEWVVPPGERPPDLVIIETVINDSDALLESQGDATAIRRALEGIVRGIKTAAPKAELLFVLAHLRTELPQARRSGTLAWVHGDAHDAAHAYTTAAPAIHEQVAEHYGIPSVNLRTALRSLPAAALDSLFRDDCHTTPAGAAVMASVVAACVKECIAPNAANPSTSSPLGSAGTPAPLPPAMDPLHWAGGRTRPVMRNDLQLAPDSASTQVMDGDPLTGQRAPWWLLAPGDDALDIEFAGTALALLTHVGPDAGVVRCVVTEATSGAAVREVRSCLFDTWSYYYRLAVVLLVEGLPSGRYRARITLEATPPDRSVAKRPLQPCVAGELRLWLSHVLVMNAAAYSSRALTAAAEPAMAECATQQDGAAPPPVALQRQPASE